MTEKEAREALTETIRDALIDYADSGEHVAPETFSDGPEIGAAIDALLAARTEAIAQMLRTRGLELIDLADGNETVDNVLRAQGAAFLSAANEARRDWGDTE